MTTTPQVPSEIEERLRAALTARAHQVRTEDLAPLAPVVAPRPRWQSPWVVLATAAVVLLILGVVFQGLGPDPRSDRIAPRPDTPQPDAPRVTLPPDIGRAWTADDVSTPAQVDLDGDGTNETVDFLAEPTKKYDGRIRLQTTLSSTGEEAYGIADLDNTIGTYALEPIDADGDGDQELVLPHENRDDGLAAPANPLVFDLRDGLLVQAVVEHPELLGLGNFPVPDSQTEFYGLVRSQRYWVAGGHLISSRSRSSFASGNMTTTRPATLVLDSWEWVLDDDGVLHPEPGGCLVETPRGTTKPCPAGARDSIPDVGPASTSVIGVGEQAAYVDGYPQFDAEVVPGSPPVLAVQVRGSGGKELTHVLDLPDPRVDRKPPTGLFYDGASLVVTSGSDPSRMEVLIAPGDELFSLTVAGEVPLGSGATDDGRAYRSWVTDDQDGRLVTVVAGEGDTWVAWAWQLAGPRTMAPLPMGEVCFDDVEDPSTARSC